MSESINLSSTEVEKSLRPFAAAGQRRRRWPWDPKTTIGLLIVVIALVCAIAAPIIAPDNPLQLFAGHELEPPSLRHLLGTDELGRDVLSRIIYGARTSMIVAAIAVSIGAALGITTGVVAGYVGGLVDSVLMRFWDAVLSVPAVLIGIMVAAFFGTGTIRTALALGFAVAPTIARVGRAAVVQERRKEYVSAAVLSGTRGPRIVMRHILPNAMGPLLTQLALTAGFAVLVEAALSYVGLGTQPPEPSWGGMVQGSQGYIPGAPWYWASPGVAVGILVVGLNLIADGLRDKYDPHQSVAVSRWI